MKHVGITSVCEIQVGKTPSRSNPEYWGNGSLWLSIADMNQGSILETTKETITAKAIKECNCKLVPRNTVLFSFKLSIGKVGITDTPMYTNEAIAAFIIKDHSKLDTKFLFYALKSVDYSIGSNKAVMGKTLNKEQLTKIEIPLPPLADQKKIVKILDQADVLCQKRRQAIDFLDNYLKSVFLQMFGDPVKNPKGWKTMELGKLCDMRRGASPRPIKEFIGNDIAWIKIGDATNGDDVYITETKVKIKKEGESKSVPVKEGDLIFANCGVTLGFARIMKIKGCVHDGWLVFQNIDPKVNKMFLLKLINHITKYFQEIAPDGTQPNLNTEIMKNFAVILPAIEKQNKFSEIVNKHQLVKKKMLAQSVELETQFHALMQKAFKGKL